MIKLMFCLRRKDGLTRQQFQDYWHDDHGRLGVGWAAELGFARYVQSHTLESPINDALQAGRGGPEAYDGVVELWYEDEAAVQATFSTDEGRRAARALLDDEPHFIDAARSPVFLVQEKQLYPPG